VKIEYDVSLYRKIANFAINEIVQVTNRKSRKSTIHITNISKLSWHELQLLVVGGADGFTKKALLYQEYSDKKLFSETVLRGEFLSSSEATEINKYIKIYRESGFTKHFEVNKLISVNNRWGEFKTIRSLNNHGKHKEIKGIQPKYFEIICNILSISGERGLPLDAYKKH